jgi:hypothetical protein
MAGSIIFNRRNFIAGAASAAMVFSSNGIDQRRSDLFVRAHGGRGDDITTVSGRGSQIDPAILLGSSTLHVIAIGQSNRNNSVLGAAYVPNNPAALFNMSIGHRGAIFIAKEPLMSSDIPDGHADFQMADQIVTSGRFTKVIVTNVSIGGSYAADWAPGGGTTGGAHGPSNGAMAYRLSLTQRCIINAGIDSLKTVIGVSIGEWDSDSPGTSQANMTAALQGMINECKNVGLLRSGRVMFVDLCTRLTNSSGLRNPIRAAQAAVVDGGLVRSGFDMDTLSGPTYREAANIHFTTTGAASLAAGRLSAMSSWLSS